MERQMENKDFKYILQDITRIFLGRELTYGDLLDLEEIPFKLKAITNNYFLKDSTREEKVIDHLNRITEQEFSYQIYDQIKLRIRLNRLVHTRTIFGKESDKRVSVECGLKEYLEKYVEEIQNGDAFIEELVISKLALMAIGC